MAAKIRGLGVATVYRLGSTHGGVVFSPVGQAGGREEVTLAAVTVCGSLRHSGARTQGRRGSRSPLRRNPNGKSAPSGGSPFRVHRQSLQTALAAASLLSPFASP